MKDVNQLVKYDNFMIEKSEEEKVESRLEELSQTIKT